MPHDHEASGAALVVVNPKASKLGAAGSRTSIVDAVVRAVRARTGSEPELHVGHLDELPAAIDRVGATLVVSVGGDGTIRAVASAVVDRAIAVAIVPGGTGNVLAGALGIRGIGPAEDVIRHGTARSIDVGRVRWGRTGESQPTGEGIFLVACGMGADARIMDAAEHEWKRRIRFGAYIGAAVRELTRLTPADLIVTADGERSVRRGYFALVANCGQIIPGRVGPREPIDPQDGRLDLLVLGASDPIAGMRGAVELLVRTGPIDEAVLRRRVTEVRLEASPPQPIQVDGDVIDAGWLEASVDAAGLTVLTASR